MKKRVFDIFDYGVAGLAIFALLLNFFFRPNNFLFAPIFWVAIFGSIPTLWLGAKDFLKRKITIDSFNGVALGFSLGTRDFDSTVFIVLMLAAARLLDRFTEDRSQKAVEALLKVKPKTAKRESDGTIQQVPVEEIEVGDAVVVEAGDRVPVDGKVIFGEGLMNEAPVTGESKLVRKTIGDLVWAASLNEGSVIKLKTERVGKQSMMERIVALVEEASRNKSKSERLADRAAGYFLPIVLLVSAATYFATRNATMAIAILLVACADDLAVAIPLAMTAAFGEAARRGVIIKGGSWLERLGKLKTLILDKTGTLTYGEPRVTDKHILGKYGEEEIWQFVAVAEKYSSHPIGRALFAEAEKHIKEVSEPEKFEVFKGKGVFAKWRGKEIYEGDEDIFDLAGAKIRDHHFLTEKESREHGATAVFLVVDKNLEAIFILSDQPRPEAKESVAALKRLGVEKILMFSGDSKEVAGRVSRELGMDDFRAEMTPESKMRELEEELKRKKIVAMVGDGINDAPALARADVGIAMGAVGTEAAIEAADVVLMTDNLKRLPEMVEVSRNTFSVIRGNVIIWGISNLIGFSLVWSGIAGLTLAAFYNFATDFLPLINSARLFFKPKN